MEVLFLNLLKSSGILLLFWGTYQLFLRKETLFESNRWFLVMGILTALVFPYLKLKHYVDIAPETQMVNLGSTVPIQQTVTEGGFTWDDGLYLGMIIYGVGCLLLLLRFIVQLHAIYRLRSCGETWLESPFLHVRTQQPIAPFSFFRSLFYHPKQFSTNELEIIITHEKEHARQWHTVDVLLVELLCVFFWWNPLAWYYKKTVKQNLEYLADQEAITQNTDKKEYQLLLLKQATGLQKTVGTNFYNSLIKKRIVMLNQNQSKRSNALKSLIILPMLGFFLWSFNTETVYETESVKELAGIESVQTVELTITKDTSNDQLEGIKKDLAKDDIDFSYTAVRNESGEIIDISIQLSGESSEGESFSSNYQSNSDEPIATIFLFYDDASNTVSIGSAKQKRIKIHTDGAHTTVWDGMDEIGEHNDIVIITEKGKKKVLVNGKEMDEEELEEMELSLKGLDNIDDDNIQIHVVTEDSEMKHIKLKKKKAKKGKQVMILKDADDEKDIEVISGDGSFLFIDTDGDANPLYLIDGKEATAKEVKQLSPDDVATVDVSKGKASVKKYGKKAKDGVVEIITKKKN